MTIHDELSNIGLTPQKKWKLRHLEKHFEAADRYNKKLALQRELKSLIQSRDMTGMMKKSAIESQVLKHHAKGRSPADIAVWMTIPMSKVNQVLRENGITT